MTEWMDEHFYPGPMDPYPAYIGYYASLSGSNYLKSTAIHTIYQMSQLKGVGITDIPEVGEEIVLGDGNLIGLVVRVIKYVDGQLSIVVEHPLDAVLAKAIDVFP